MVGTSRLVHQHEGSRIIHQLRLLPEALYRPNTIHFTVLQQVGQHFQKMRFTAAKEAGNPDTNISGRNLERLQVIVEEGDDMLLQFPRNDVLVQFLHQNIEFVLVDLDDTVNRAVNAFFEHFLDSHTVSPLQITLNAR